MKRPMLCAALVSMMAVVPAMSFAQTAGNGPLTRAQVVQEIVDLESVGYNPAHVNDSTYPEETQAAMQRLAAKRANEARLAQERQVADSGYGNPPELNGESGAPAAAKVPPLSHGVSHGPSVPVGEAPQAYPHH
ncbi:DUF4148 domain-containing protein [Paraburkholderia ferrariae]|jgi:hypothetical protein|uniref:DUF4148 domain-containing protein n=1 Tax=Paraburkholderia ferrariae TaxID=386056 RepID=UPI0007C87265|nr:DUF4148 domain-containing protein [Paraburkholderia ferrariae]